ncbi:MAG: epoxyqueuosine reductase QueH [Oscillospiraceae bacterium]
MVADNYQLILDGILKNIKAKGETPRLLLHACCAPCESYVLEYLSQYFDIIVYYYNPNIAPQAEYERRKEEAKRLIQAQPHINKVQFCEADYKSEDFYAAVKGYEDCKEGKERCFICYRLRLEHTALAAKDKHCDYFASTLSISPHKNAEKLNEIGYSLEKQYNIKFLPSDFKKRNGYKRSLELSREYGLYRQDYCGCAFSINKD